jgi:SNF2 family DNA or RNA helicase
MPKPKFHIVTIANPANRVLNAMNLFSGDNVSSVIEMLNSDAIGEAAEKLNIKVNTVAGVFRALLGNKYSSYLYAGDVCSFIEHCKEIADERKIYDVEDRTIERYGKKELLKFKEIEYDQPHIDKLLDETFEEYTKQKKALGLEIQRVKDNLRHGECAICEENITEESQYIIVSGCCNIVCCAKCGFEAHGLKDRYNQLVKGRCAGCRAEISCKSLIVISDEINLDDIYQENIEEYDEEEKEVPQSEEDLKLSAQDTKGCLVVNILKNKKINADKRAEVVIPAMMSGEDVMKEPSVRKMLIFSNYDSGLTAIIKDLEAYKIQYWKLEGTYKEIDYICELFRKFEGSCVLVINSLKHCSGLNLQNATDLVFFHHIKNTEIEGQVVGRGHRLGRTSPLNVWYLTYDNELNHLLETRQVRYLSKEEIDLEEEILKSK